MITAHATRTADTETTLRECSRRSDTVVISITSGAVNDVDGGGHTLTHKQTHRNTTNRPWDDDLTASSDHFGAECTHRDTHGYGINRSIAIVHIHRRKYEIGVGAG